MPIKFNHGSYNFLRYLVVSFFLISPKFVLSQTLLTTQTQIQDCLNEITNTNVNSVSCQIAPTTIDIDQSIVIPLTENGAVNLICHGTKFRITASNFTVISLDGDWDAGKVHDWDVTIDGCNIDSSYAGGDVSTLQSNVTAIGFSLNKPVTESSAGRFHIHNTRIGAVAHFTGNSSAFNTEGTTESVLGEITNSYFATSGTVINLKTHESRVRISDSVILSPTNELCLSILGNSINAAPKQTVRFQSKNNYWENCSHIKLASGIATFNDFFSNFTGAPSTDATTNTPWFVVGKTNNNSNGYNKKPEIYIKGSIRGTSRDQGATLFELLNFASLFADIRINSLSLLDSNVAPFLTPYGRLIDSDNSFFAGGFADIRYLPAGNDFYKLFGDNMETKINGGTIAQFRIDNGRRTTTLANSELYNESIFVGKKDCINLGQVTALTNDKPIITFEKETILQRYSCYSSQSTNPQITLSGGTTSLNVDCSSNSFQSASSIEFGASTTATVSSSNGSSDGETLLCLITSDK